MPTSQDTTIFMCTTTTTMRIQPIILPLAHASGVKLYNLYSLAYNNTVIQIWLPHCEHYAKQLGCTNIHPTPAWGLYYSFKFPQSMVECIHSMNADLQTLLGG